MIKPEPSSLSSLEILPETKMTHIGAHEVSSAHALSLFPGELFDEDEAAEEMSGKTPLLSWLISVNCLPTILKAFFLFFFTDLCIRVDIHHLHTQGILVLLPRAGLGQ